jgi:hypothetical protein
MAIGHPLRSLSEGARRGSRLLSRLGHRHRLPALTSVYNREIVATLERCGALVTDLAAMAQSDYIGCSRLLVAGREIFADVSGQTTGEGRKTYVQVAPQDAILARPEILLWGLQERLLAIAENYIGLPVAYRGVLARRDVADGQQVETRYWHCDGEDVRILKIIVYLSDVGPDDGPFCYVAKARTPKGALKTFDGGRVSDAVLDEKVASDGRVACTGPAGTVLFADTCSLWHRGAVGTARDRLTLFFSYNSQSPLRPADCGPILPLDGLRASVPMSARQRAAVEYAY